ncbi:MAG: HAD-IA family hydrolase [Patescibacteria group bacterium]|nr:HAD-IA family hydrolase [Patescibacteria group bacterium]
MKIKTILFDLSDVLVKGLEGSEVQIANKLNKPVGEVSDALFTYDFNEFWLGNISEDNFLSKLINDLDWDLTINEMKLLIRENFIEIPETRNLIKHLKKSFHLILISVNPPEWAKEFEDKFNLIELFDQIHYSYQIKYTKREPEAFKFLIEKYKLDPSEVILIDDSTRNLNTAKTIGILGIKFINVKQTIEELKNFDIIIKN